ncbi:MotA/TolQ/ExbB proton channel family protein [Entomospira nematocerorum]|uniref:MotA/TolQ/ExbB proton channel family protein n=1 Tax=Entomospira nematocerorum TaxID=2719987 RepID=A0A968GAK9_9SPIO|nr:MotA/TolQ/ExbB proton channel family protein [Entomospira nematocera]NIZ46357.1 MotA/TolQ/ExbB proton channel family protein [Entomospira nematocera]WDI33838.1 MotA/TolQ/ExbB proton channel family protein [Entomospira nematocera]
MRVVELIIDNIIVLTPLIVLSIVATAIVIERFLYFSSIKEDSALTRRVGALYTAGKYDATLEALGESRAPESVLLRYAASNRFALEDQLRTRLEIIARNRLALMERRITYLSTIANIATLMGLLGTVLGMITAFSQMNLHQTSNPYVLAGGIASALVTTAAGLMIAIPSLFFYNYFIEAITRRGEHFERLISEILSNKGVRL